jgi:hypothetical protein
VLVVPGNGGDKHHLSLWWAPEVLPWGPFSAARRDRKRNLVMSVTGRSGGASITLLADIYVVPRECQFT